MTTKWSFSEDFKNKDIVFSIIRDWKEGRNDFELYTSGTTAISKKVILSRELLLWNARQTLNVLDLNREKQLCCVPVNKVGGFMQVIRGLIYGWETHFVEPLSDPLLNVPENHNYSLVSFTPQQLANCLSSSKSKLTCFRNVLVGSSRISNQVSRQLDEFISKNQKTTFYETYGMTETASHIALRNINRQEKLFQPQPGVIVSGINNQMRIIIPELGLDFLSNDHVRVSMEGFTYLGRIDEMVNSGGIKIFPRTLEPLIEDVLQSAGIDRAFYLTKKEDVELGEKLVLVLEGKPVQDSTFLLDMIKRAVPKYQDPKEIIFLEDLMRTDTGKIKRVQFSNSSSKSFPV